MTNISCFCVVPCECGVSTKLLLGHNSNKDNESHLALGTSLISQLRPNIEIMNLKLYTFSILESQNSF